MAAGSGRVAALLLLLLCPAMALGCVCPGGASACTDEERACMQTLCDPDCHQWLGSLVCLEGCRQCLQESPLECRKSFQDCTSRCEQPDQYCHSNCHINNISECDVGCDKKNDECVSQCLKAL